MAFGSLRGEAQDSPRYRAAKAQTRDPSGFTQQGQEGPRNKPFRQEHSTLSLLNLLPFRIMDEGHIHTDEPDEYTASTNTSLSSSSRESVHEDLQSLTGESHAGEVDSYLNGESQPTTNTSSTSAQLPLQIRKPSLGIRSVVQVEEGDIDMLAANLRDLIKATRKMFAQLGPLITIAIEPHSELVLVKTILVDQAQAYITTVETSVEIAEAGTHVADDAIRLCQEVSKLMGPNVQDIRSIPQETRETLLQFLDDMYQKADAAVKSAESVVRDLRGIRTELSRVQQIILGSSSHITPLDISVSGSSVGEEIDAQQRLKTAVEQVEGFLQHVGEPIKWWQRLRSDLVYLKDAVPKPEGKFNPLGQKVICERWTSVRRKYVEYSDEMTRLVDSSRSSFKQIKDTPKPDDVEVVVGVPKSAATGLTEKPGTASSETVESKEVPSHRIAEEVIFPPVEEPSCCSSCWTTISTCSCCIIM